MDLPQFRVTVRLDELEHADLTRICDSYGLTASDVMRRGLRLAFDELDFGQPPGFPPERLQRGRQSGPGGFSPIERVAP